VKALQTNRIKMIFIFLLKQEEAKQKLLIPKKRIGIEVIFKINSRTFIILEVFSLERNNFFEVRKTNKIIN
jgi:hypothetical protein